MINEFIKAYELRVVGEPEEADQPDVQLGVMSRGDALMRARELSVDLVCISPGAEPPVCKLIDYGRYRFQLDKKKKLVKKNSVQAELKEIKLSYTIDVHDFNVRIRAAQKFLSSGDKVKAVVQFKGREMQHTNIGANLLQRLAQDLAEFGSTDGPPKMSGNRMELYVSPKPKGK
ncbi:translation initiation factor IF-3 [Pavlovales sp. CCMP2436]|nr:translation initiation factor IF-3 [Pavlovales sp. CCMP2436]